jgi:hypothetical protein
VKGNCPENGPLCGLLKGLTDGRNIACTVVVGKWETGGATMRISFRGLLLIVVFAIASEKGIAKAHAGSSFDGAWSVVINPDYSVRPDGACHQWRKIPPRKLSMGLVADERLGWATGRAEAS